MLLYWLWLANRPNVSDGVKCALMRQFSDPQDVYFASEEELRQVPGMTRQALEALKGRDLEEAEKILEDCARLNIQVLTMKDDRYPPGCGAFTMRRCSFIIRERCRKSIGWPL